MRQLKRSIAKANMRDAGLRRINKPRYTTDAKGRITPVGSLFSQRWREFVAPDKKWQKTIDKARRASV